MIMHDDMLSFLSASFWCSVVLDFSFYVLVYICLQFLATSSNF